MSVKDVNVAHEAKKYQFEKLTDLSILNEDELVRWVEDFKIWIALRRQSLPPELAGLVRLADSMQWVDDGETGIKEISIRVDPNFAGEGNAK